MEQVPITPSLWSSTVLGERGEVKEDYDQCFLEFEAGGELCTCSVIPIAVVQRKLLVAVPMAAWSKIPADRYLPKTGLTKPVLVEVEGLVLDELEDGAEPKLCKVWVGFLRGDLCRGGVVGEPEEPGVIDFVDDGGAKMSPLAPPLVELANDHFAFFSAASGAHGGEPEEEAEAAGGMETRMQSMELALERIRQSLEGLGQGGRSGYTNMGAGAKAKAVPPGLDAGVVRSALAAGIPQDHLDRLSTLLVKPNRMEEAEAGRRKAVNNVLSESEEEEEELIPAEGGAGGEQAPVERAVVQLTRLVSQMAKQKAKKTGLDAVLERVEASGGAEGSSGLGSSGRSKAGAYKRLRAALVERPEWISKSVEAMMEEDFNVARSRPGAEHVATSSRAWVEHRSKLQHYTSSIRFAWAVAGIHDCIKQGRVEEARSRCCLTLAAIDQSSIDNGSWTLAQEILLEQAAPFTSFVGRRGPDLQEQPASRLLDERLLEVVVWRIKDRDQYIESRKRLGAAGRYTQPPGGGDPPKPVPTPKPKPKWKGRGKGEQGGTPGVEGGPTE